MDEKLFSLAGSRGLESRVRVQVSGKSFGLYIECDPDWPLVAPGKLSQTVKI